MEGNVAVANPLVVLHFRDGTTSRCRLTSSFEPRDRQIAVESVDGEAFEVEVNRLKAVFFPKDPRRREADLELGAVQDSQPGPVARVEFFDGEVIRGVVTHYSVENAGFWLYPSAPESNNQRIFVVARALHTVSLEG